MAAAPGKAGPPPEAKKGEVNELRTVSIIDLRCDIIAVVSSNAPQPISTAQAAPQCLKDARRVLERTELQMGNAENVAGLG
jgi:hypothetical protein